ncbi:MAG TPA: hypothetical protein ENI29_01445 [bacterium]|nr:hypothetical protein [bacterium]
MSTIRSFILLKFLSIVCINNSIAKKLRNKKNIISAMSEENVAASEINIATTHMPNIGPS